MKVDSPQKIAVDPVQNLSSISGKAIHEKKQKKVESPSKEEMKPPTPVKTQPKAPKEVKKQKMYLAFRESFLTKKL